MNLRPISPLRAPARLPRPLLAGIAATAVAAVVGVAAADTYTATFASPTLDRWNYPFNPTPGTRITASTFGNEPGAPEFDNRDGQFIVGFDTGAQVPAGLGASRYEVVSCVVEVTVANDFVIPYDPSVDPYTVFLAASNPERTEDEDPGQPIEIYGVGFRNGFSRANWVETSPFTVAGQNLLNPSVRNAYALGWRDGAWVDVSNSVRGRWTPEPFAVGTIDGLKPGDLVPIGTAIRFSLDVSRPEVQAYLREAVDAGRLRLSVTSLTLVAQQSGDFPVFYCRENPIVTATGVGAATLSMTVATSTCVAADLDCSGSVGAQDLAILLGAWGGGGPADLDGNGTVGASDLAVLLGAWGN
ncbi:MAG: hypothetical protein GC172_09670 [Phycisphaera sp.]|nr:hypothetical protein [Phycisphaera sp.]